MLVGKHMARLLVKLLDILMAKLLAKASGKEAVTVLGLEQCVLPTSKFSSCVDGLSSVEG